jgi:orotate phosphoribosyltransferase-like protein
MEIAQPEVVEKIKALRSDGLSMRAIADKLEISSRTVWKVISRGQMALSGTSSLVG